MNADSMVNTCRFDMTTFDWIALFIVSIVIIGILYLSLDKGIYKPKEKPVFTVNWEKNDSKFVGNFDVKGVEFRSHKSVWG